ncbi:MAG: YihA family ribosome biogenesis GTP-binding protein [Flavobacteriales bacterium CG03_land_8_20_14_0_80_35_15]|nr:YihA family ribosome biogenesis GTP-binding protein [Zetaproteobacteria bacterium]NDK18473.1 YihA family ribosome biogenesis GTP-binding protein [Flavobacteriales bacterium]OIO12604.1 MAG: YihA family ribosome biogenesis GTP-binding protein [Flavobacteriaceae bacterium CG1_02_35_72]PIR14518.1 MAG: YihA family ribosome biogenesis GTP-binding protein [Flavobacteriales bacterium CG11_big_fil_rev_8_21_14_0_20_35_7]PIV16063.1 MAG: YihA family ribosome biogenesis GTP-binding protein [Flavobacteria
MNIKSAEFIISNTDVANCPKELLPEYAFIGRSNVGKSSLINMLVNQKNLAKTSGKPGKTQLINHFKINNAWFLVDLPGYGYAQISKSKRKTFQEFIKAYFLERKQLVCTFVLIDSRLEPQKIDLEFMQFLGENNIAFCVVFTKSDKLKTTKLNNNIAIYNDTMTQSLWESMPTYYVTSAIAKAGKDELLNYIETLNQEVAENF